MRVPTDKEIEEAKEYLRQRLDAELSMRTNLQIVMIEAAKQIIDISYRYKISPELFRFSKQTVAGGSGCHYFIPS